MGAPRPQVRGVTPALVAPVGAANPGDGLRLVPAEYEGGWGALGGTSWVRPRPRPSPCPPTGPGRIGGGGAPLRRPRTFGAAPPGFFSHKKATAMIADNSLDF